MCSLTTERLCKMLSLQKLNNTYKVKGASSRIPSDTLAFSTATSGKQGCDHNARFLVLFVLFSTSLDHSHVSLPQSEKSQWLREAEGDMLRASLHMSLRRPGGVHQHSSLNLSEGRLIIGSLFQQAHTECPLWTLQQQARLTLVFYYIIFLLGETC